MHALPDSVKVQYESCLKQNQIAPSLHQSYRKWLSYYWDFCHKFSHNPFSENSLAAFLLKLEEKQQSEGRRESARQAVQLYLSQPFGTSPELSSGVSAPIPESPGQAHSLERPWPKSSQKRKLTRPQAQPESSHPPFESVQAPPLLLPEDQQSPEVAWQEVYHEIARAIKIRHFSPKTLKSYSGWTRQFQAFTKSKNPRQLNKQDVSEFLSYLTTEKLVSASTQNQAFNALLFVFKHVLKRNLGQLSKIPRAKRKPYIPVVLSRAEVESLCQASRTL